MKTVAHKCILLVTTAGVLWVALLPLDGQVKPRDTVILKGAPMGGVKFLHKLHVERAANKCESCHHPSKPEMPAKALQQACTDCHTKPLPASLKTTRQAAFHNSKALAGICIDCHKQANRDGKKSPLKCTECHRKENI